MFDDLMQKLDKLEPLLYATRDEELISGAKFLAERIKNPNSFVTLLGETSSGKSTLINGVLGKKILPVKASPTTGAITEVEFCADRREDYYAINKDATIERIGADDFVKLSEHPDNRLQRVKLRVSSPSPNLNNMRLFDTPGYGSIVEEHEEILKEFLPNSDVVIYTVSYRIGIQEEDYAFLGFLKELLRKDAEIVLAVNFCPAGVTAADRRISEIYKYVSGVMACDIKMFLIPFMAAENGNEYPLPHADDLWGYAASVVNSDKHRKILHDAFDDYIIGLYKSCDSKISMDYTKSLIDKKELDYFIAEQKESAKKIRMAIPELIEPEFEKLINQMPKLLKTAKRNALEKANAEIDAAKPAKMEETIGFVNSHILPFTIRQENKEIMRYLEIELDDLNNKVEDYINKEVQNFTDKVTIRLNTYTENAVKNIAGKIVGNLATNGLKNVFAGFGGAGGANAGIANAASHALKNLGNLFGKTFSRETHNALKHFLARIGATSMKTVGAAITVIMELVMVAIDYNTWKPKLKKKVAEGADKWEKATLEAAVKDLNSLKEENIKNINEIAADIENSFKNEESGDVDILKKNYELSNRIGKEIGAQ